MRAGVQVIEVETICTDIEEHRRRIETRVSEVPDLILPDWQTVIGRDYEPWDRDHLIIDTARFSVEACIQLIRAALCVRARVTGAIGLGPNHYQRRGLIGLTYFEIFPLGDVGCPAGCPPGSRSYSSRKALASRRNFLFANTSTN